MLLFKLIVLGFLSQADVKRISSSHKDLGEVQKVYLHAGLISVIEFPETISEVRLGNLASLKAQISQVSPRELTIYLSSQAVEPTNLIVRADRRLYVFDIIPSRRTHQDYLKISGAFGAPEASARGSLIFAGKLDPSGPEKPSGKLIKSLKLGGDE